MGRMTSDHPPSIRMSWPVRYADASDARNTHNPTMSSGCDTRPSRDQIDRHLGSGRRPVGRALRRRDRTRRNRVGRDPIGRPFDREPARERHDGALRRAVRGPPDHPFPRRDRGDVDDPALVLTAHKWVDCLAGVQDAADVHAHDPIEVRRGVLRRRLVDPHRAVIDQDIDLPPSIGGEGCHPLAGRGVAHVGRARSALHPSLRSAAAAALPLSASRLAMSTWAPAPASPRLSPNPRLRLPPVTIATRPASEKRCRVGRCGAGDPERSAAIIGRSGPPSEMRCQP